MVNKSFVMVYRCAATLETWDMMDYCKKHEPSYLHLYWYANNLQTFADRLSFINDLQSF